MTARPEKIVASGCGSTLDDNKLGLNPIGQSSKLEHSFGMDLKRKERIERTCQRMDTVMQKEELFYLLCH
ncbi:hypothetical protein QE152_g19116 [Popillia japonica]|uniref:Uncharacterized protein n=1 Tax=Popillia japonica TaxID=7064 RepID=A0AAW1L0W1_POPJA